MTDSQKVDAFLEKHVKWKKQFELIRAILEETELKEEIKWGAPAYTLNGKILLGFGAFKNHMGIWFHQGVFLKDTGNHLITGQEKTKALRQWRFEEGDEIDAERISAYVQETIENCLAGKEVKPQRTKISEVTIPPLLKNEFQKNPAFEAAFNTLSAGKRKEYANYIGEAKRAATQIKRLEKIIPMIQDGQGLNDKYKNC